MSRAPSGSTAVISWPGKTISGPRELAHKKGDIVPLTIRTDGTRLTLKR
jgi:hypothetical protein